ncbi:XkdX family protein [Crassaminicella profunda]|nr:XkdX family protein [Crassaminicella profunda]QZY55099.1 XkdX family protein [Crassaminicella profunda]
MHDWYKIAKERYPNNWMTKEQLDKILSLGWITRDQYDEIVVHSKN